MSHPPLRRRTRGALLLAAALSVTGSGAGNAAARAGTDGAFPYKFADCAGLWFKTYSPRGALQAAVPQRYEVLAGQTNGSPIDDVASQVYGNLYIQTDRCVDGKGRPATISRVSVQVRQPAFDPGRRPVAHPTAEKPVGNFWEFYYLLAVVLPRGEAATRDLGRYLARQGLPVHVGTVDATLDKMGAGPTAYVAPRTSAQGGAFDYRVDGAASNAFKEGLHEHVSSYYYDVAGRDGRVRATRMVVDSLTVDWLAVCNATSAGARMSTLMGAGANPNGACFHMEGPHTWVTAAKIS